MYIYESHGSESKENARFISKENAERGSEGAKEREWVCDWCKFVFYESHDLESTNLTFPLLSVSQFPYEFVQLAARYY